MSRQTLAAVVALLAIAGVGALFVGGSVLEGGTPSADGTDATTAVSTTTASTTTSPANDSSDYAFSIDRIETCGTTCRDVTATLTNTAGRTRRNVRVTTGVFADGDLLWSGNETVGTLSAGEVHTSTERVEVGFVGALAIDANDGYVTIVTVVESASGTTRFEERKKVA